MRLLFFSVSSGGSRGDDSSSGRSSRGDDSSSGRSSGDSSSMLMLGYLGVQGLNRTVRLLQRLL